MTKEEKEKAYDCPNLIEAHTWADGELHRCVAEDIDELVEFMDLFHRETGIDKESLEAYRHKVEQAIRCGSHFFLEKCSRKDIYEKRNDV